MDIKHKEFDTEAKEYMSIMHEIIDGANTAIQEEFSRTANNWTACFTSVADQLDCYREIINKRITETEERDNVNQKIEELKTGLSYLRQRYTEKDTQPNEEEKKSLFSHLSEIKGMINIIE